MGSNVALVGNPNSGKSSVFNALTGLKQTTGNFPGVTVDKKVGSFKDSKGKSISITDLPGLYSLYPTSKDEKIVVEILSNPSNDLFPELVVYVADSLQLERHLLLANQIVDLGIPLIFVANMNDLAQQEGIQLNIKKLEKSFGFPIVSVSARSGNNIDVLKNQIENTLSTLTPQKSTFKLSDTDRSVAQSTKKALKKADLTDFQALLVAHHADWLPWLSDSERETLQTQRKDQDFNPLTSQVDETMKRFEFINSKLSQFVTKKFQAGKSLTQKIDNIVTNRVLGPIIFFAIMFLVFQALYSWASYPTEWIENFFSWGSEKVTNIFGEHWYTSLISDGIIPGIGGVMVFVPQIFLLFLMITILEEIGYMSRAVFMFDRILKVFGLNGRSIVSLISGGACAIPAIMSTRTISNWKERLNTILVTPLISCSARIPVYIVLIGFIVPDEKVMGIFNMQGVAFMGLYLVSIIAALVSAYVFKLILKSKEPSYLLIELPIYKKPLLKNIFITLKDKVWTFIWEAGKIIFIISIILWVIASYGPKDAMNQATAQANKMAQEQRLDDDAKDNLEAALKLEASYAGHLGKFIEPAIKPLGFDWKIGIALITSFAAREVFVGTMATIYSVGSESEMSVRKQLASQVNPQTGKKVYTRAVALSLIVFYLFAMQCMSTLAITKRETKSWKWPIIQFVYMSALAYFCSLLVYQLMS